MQTDIRKGDEMNAILHCYDDVAHLVNQDVIEKMDGDDIIELIETTIS